VIRWLRVVALGLVVVSMIGLGVCVGLFLVANSGWVQVKVPPWLTWLFGDPRIEIWLPAMIAGWLLVTIGAVVGIAWSMWYVWRRRQYESLINKLEKELAALRNLPFNDPAPLEDLPETPNPQAAKILAVLESEERDEVAEA
jgi:hypothetical protein